MSMRDGAAPAGGRISRLIVPIAAFATVLTMATPAWASTVQIQDDSHVLNATTVQNDAATLPVGVYIWATTQDAASKSAFDTDVRNKVNATFPIVIGINTQSRHESIQIGAQSGISRNAAIAAESSANSSFVATMQSSRDYTAAVTAALDNMRTALVAGNRGRAPYARVPARSSGISLLPIILILGAIGAGIFFLRRRMRSGFRRPMPAGPPPMSSYPDYGPSYGPPYRSGMGAGAAGTIGAVGGGLLGYELGKMEGEQQQFRRDEMVERGSYGPADQGNSPDQGDWVVGQDSDFGGGPDNSGGGGDW